MKNAEFYSHIEIPETWNSLTEFAEWYMNVKMPVMIPVDTFVYVTDDATATVLFRKGQFQVEIYLLHPYSKVSTHSHPGVELFLVQIGNMDKKINWGFFGPILKDGETHENKQGSDEHGSVFLSFEKWNDNRKMTSASVNWKGKTEGPIHEALIKKHYPNAIVENGYADTTNA